MKNILKSNFYKLFRSKAFYICTIVYTVLMSAAIFILKWIDNIMIKLSETGEVITAGVNSSTMPYKDGISYGVESFYSGQALIFLAIFIAIFVTAEFTHGTMKNIVSKGFTRTKIYISLLITMSVAAFLMLIVSFLFSTLSATIVTGSFASFNGPLLLKTLRLIAIELLLHCGISSLFVMVAMVVRNNGGVIAINICILMFGTMIYQVADLLAHHFLKISEKIVISNYGLQRNIVLATSTLQDKDILRPILVGLFFIAITSALGIMGFKQTDVK